MLQKERTTITRDRFKMAVMLLINLTIIVSMAAALGVFGAAGAAGKSASIQHEDPQTQQQIKDDQLLQDSSLAINNQTLDLKVKPVLFIDDSCAELLLLLNMSDADKIPYIVIKESSILRPQGIDYYLGNDNWTYPSLICCVDNQVRGYMYAEAKTYLENEKYRHPIAKISYINNQSSPSNVNARLAAEQLNGAVIKPKQEFSFYSCVNTLEEGYQEGTVFVETEEGITETDQQLGGGICKTATLLHKIVDTLGLEETERHDHSEPVSYAEPGDEAAVSKGGWDYKFINTLDMPIKISAYQDVDYLVIEIYLVPGNLES